MKRFIIYMAFAMVTIVVLVVILIDLLIPRDYDRVMIENRGALKGVSVGGVNDFRTSLISLLQTEGYVDEDMTVDDVMVREDTVETFRDDANGAVTTFLVDIDSIKQTYRVRITDTDKGTTDIPVYIACPRASEMKYPESVCKGHYGDTSMAVELHLPYFGRLATGEEYLVKSITGNNKGEYILQIYLYSCDDSLPPTEEVEEAVRSFVLGIGDTIDYKYNVRTGYCKGDTI